MIPRGMPPNRPPTGARTSAESREQHAQNKAAAQARQAKFERDQRLAKIQALAQRRRSP